MSDLAKLGSARPSVRMGAGTVLVALLACAVVALGIYGYAQQRLHGDIVSGLRTIGQGGAAWGLYIVFDITFVGLAVGGIVFMSIVRLFHLQQLRPLMRMAQVLTLASLGMAGLCVIADLGRPLHGLMNFPRYARTMSPFFGTFSLVTCTGSVATFIYLWLDSRADAAACAARGGPFRPIHRLWAAGFRNTAAEHERHRRTSWWLSLALLPFMVVGMSTLGFVFGIQGARPGWFSTLQAPGFVVLALLSSLGILVVMAAVTRRGNPSEIPAEVFRKLGNALWMMAIVYLYIVAIEELTAGYAASEAETRVANATIAGPWATTFWFAMACFVVPTALLFVQFLRRSSSVALTVTCALLFNVAAVLKRFLLVVPSQTDGLLLPYRSGSYAPSWVELAVVGGLIALGLLACLAFARLLPIVPLHSIAHDGATLPASTRSKRGTMRTVLTAATFLCGGALAVTGFLLSARLGTDPWQDPLVPFSPVLFIAGLVMSFSAAVVYEILPDRRAAPQAPA